MNVSDFLDDMALPYSIQLESGVTTNVLQITDTAQRNSSRFSYCHRLHQGTYLVRLTYTGPGYADLSASYDHGSWPLPIIRVPRGEVGHPRSEMTQISVPHGSYADIRIWNTDSDRNIGSLEIYPTAIYRAP